MLGIFLGTPIEPFVEESSSNHKEYLDLDLNGDGGLSFDEVINHDYNTSVYLSSSLLQEIFDSCDKNNNSILKGGEIDHYFIRVKDNIKSLEK